MKSWDEQNKILQKLADDQNSMKHTLEQVMPRKRGLGTVAVEYVAQKTELERPLDVKESLKKAVLEQIYQRDTTQAAHDVSGFNMSSVRKQSLKDKFLAKLAYEDMHVRERSVLDAHGKTFEWIFRSTQQQDCSWADFRLWLQASDNQLYWITGKAGSGKSTLMRFLLGPMIHNNKQNKPKQDCYTDSRCSRFLKVWADGQPL